MTLKLSLKPGEKFVLNGAVLINGDKPTSFLVENQVTVLRDRDILQAADADTPAKRIYLAILNLYMGEGQGEGLYDEFVTQMSAYMQDITDGETLRLCVAISRDMLARQYYKALIKCRQLFDFEQSGRELVENAA
jgi:flagellar protein FlbT